VTSLDAFMKSVEKKYGAGVIRKGKSFAPLSMKRLSSGIFSFDLALGGGWPFSRISLIAGETSTGKTLLALRAASEVEKYDHATKLHRDYVDKMKFKPGRALFVDVEGGWEAAWSEANGFNVDHHVVVRPEYSEETIDIVSSALYDNIFDLIIIDSIAAMTPGKEIEADSESWQMGLAARLNNKAFRKWGAALNRLSHSDIIGPVLLCVNQFRLDFKVTYGDPRILPGGRQQVYSSSIIVYTGSAEYEDKDAELGSVILKGLVKKNKTFIPRQNYNFRFILKDLEDFSKCSVDNASALVKYGLKYKLIVKKGSSYSFGDRTFDTQKALICRVSSSEPLALSLWRSILTTILKIKWEE